MGQYASTGLGAGVGLVAPEVFLLRSRVRRVAYVILWVLLVGFFRWCWVRRSRIFFRSSVMMKSVSER